MKFQMKVCRLFCCQKFLLGLMLTSIFWKSTYAAERFEFYNGIRQMGMGGASIAIVNDETAVILNPAGLGKIRDRFMTLMDPDVTASSSGALIVNSNNMLSLFDLEVLREKLNRNPGRHFYFNTQFFPSLVVPNFGIGLLAKYEVAAAVSADGTTLDYHYRNDMGLLLGYAFRFWDGRLKLGFNGKFINRVTIDETGLDATTTHTQRDLMSEGGGIGADVGLLMTMPWAWLPTLSVVGRDVGHTYYNVTNGYFFATATRPSEVRQSIDAAIAFFPILSNRVRTSWTFEVRDVLNYAQEEDKSRLYHGGVELNMGDLFFLRAGMNQRYWTAGAEFAVERMQMQFATYGEEIGIPGALREDRRYALKFVFRF